MYFCYFSISFAIRVSVNPEWQPTKQISLCRNDNIQNVMETMSKGVGGNQGEGRNILTRTITAISVNDRQSACKLTVWRNGWLSSFFFFFATFGLDRQNTSLRQVLCLQLFIHHGPWRQYQISYMTNPLLPLTPIPAPSHIQHPLTKSLSSLSTCLSCKTCQWCHVRTVPQDVKMFLFIVYTHGGFTDCLNQIFISYECHQTYPLLCWCAVCTTMMIGPSQTSHVPCLGL